MLRAGPGEDARHGDDATDARQRVREADEGGSKNGGEISGCVEDSVRQGLPMESRGGSA